MMPLGALPIGASLLPSSASAFNLMDEVSEHVVKYADLLVIKVFCVAEEKIGYAPENFSATIARAYG
ncbi:MAG: hypothetical protein ABWX81_07830 [Pseudolabrys sp.]